MNGKNPPESYHRPVEIAENIYWVGFNDEKTNFHCNPYLVIDGEQAVLIDAGSRPDFALVMMKVLQAGILPEQIVALVYQHNDPDLCGSMSNMVDICANPDLKILSYRDNHMFLGHYLEREKRRLLHPIDTEPYFTFGGRTLTFHRTPYAHDRGSFVTYDAKTKTLFTADLFGSVSRRWDLFVELTDQCPSCRISDPCAAGRPYCPLPEIFEFHRKVMPSGKALRLAMQEVGSMDVALLAPQHGSVLTRKEDIELIVKALAELDRVGIDGWD